MPVLLNGLPILLNDIPILLNGLSILLNDMPYTIERFEQVNGYIVQQFAGNEYPHRTFRQKFRAAGIKPTAP